MPDIPLIKESKRGKSRIVGWISYAGEYKPGDPPPIGYSDWFEWARVQDKAGLKQKRCSRCSLFKFPQEIARTEKRQVTVYATKKDAANQTNPITRTEDAVICNDCNSLKGDD